MALHPLLAERFSPAMFDPEHEAAAEDVEALLEAARWAPSAGNAQPWAFLVGRRGEPVHARLVRHLAGSSAGWAPSASVLVANLAHRFVEGTDWEFSEFALYDLGQAVAHMTIQAQALGLRARQFRAFDRAGLTAEFAVPAHWEVTTMTAFGRPLADSPSRQRRTVNVIQWMASGRPAPGWATSSSTSTTSPPRRRSTATSWASRTASPTRATPSSTPAPPVSRSTNGGAPSG
jgi:nitroreductase